MKREAAAAMTICILVCLLACSGSQPDSHSAVGTLPPHDATEPVCVLKDVDLGLIEDDSPASHEFTIHNSSTQKFTVLGLTKTCGCEAVSLQEGTVVPAGGSVKFTYSLSKASAGTQSGRLTLNTDSDSDLYKHIEFRLTATFPKQIWSIPDEIMLNSGSRDECELRVYARDLKVLDKLVEIGTSRGLVTVTQTGRSEQFLIFRVRLVPGDRPGISNDYITFYMSDVKVPRHDVRVRSGVIADAMPMPMNAK